MPGTIILDVGHLPLWSSASHSAAKVAMGSVFVLLNRLADYTFITMRFTPAACRQHRDDCLR
jgi:hypothetical protein